MDRRFRLDPAADPLVVVNRAGAAAIDTPRLVLRGWREEDKEPFFRHTNTESVMRWLGGVKTREFLDGAIDKFAAWQAERGFTFWAVERKEDAALLGFCGLKRADDAGSPVEGEIEIGWRLREDCWGRGYAKEAAIASLDFAFERVGAERVVALTVEGNGPSWGLMERLGMTRRPDLDYGGVSWAEGPIVIYSIAREEWSTDS
ncbi:MAG TPA: GNAT family N-acetyltransferase [Allosphingosinicella sp.]|jgi:RimJ/RimL family protein N-acetyltransferase